MKEGEKSGQRVRANTEIWRQSLCEYRARVGVKSPSWSEGVEFSRQGKVFHGPCPWCAPNLGTKTAPGPLQELQCHRIWCTKRKPSNLLREIPQNSTEMCQEIEEGQRVGVTRTSSACYSLPQPCTEPTAATGTPPHVRVTKTQPKPKIHTRGIPSLGRDFWKKTPFFWKKTPVLKRFWNKMILKVLPDPNHSVLL